jgi:hypothetical protein
MTLWDFLNKRPFLIWSIFLTLLAILFSIIYLFINEDKITLKAFGAEITKNHSSDEVKIKSNEIKVIESNIDSIISMSVLPKMEDFLQKNDIYSMGWKKQNVQLLKLCTIKYKYLPPIYEQAKQNVPYKNDIKNVKIQLNKILE